MLMEGADGTVYLGSVYVEVIRLPVLSNVVSRFDQFDAA